MVDKININGLQLASKVGVYEDEKHFPQPLILDLSIDICFDQAVIGDDLRSTINYASLSKRLREEASKNHVNLIETRLTELINIVLMDSRVNSVYGKLYKPLALNGALVSVERTISRS